MQQDGYDNTKYIVDMNLKLAFPFIILVMIVIGVPISIRVEKGGIPLAVSFGIGLCFLYMATLGLARSLGYANVFPPFLAAWVANVIFMLLGLYLMMQFER